MVLLASAFDQSKYLRAEDVPQEKTLRIKSATEEQPSVWEPSARRSSCFGSPTPTKGWCSTAPTTARSGLPTATTVAGWAGKLIVVFQTQADFRGRLVPALRVRIPPPKQASGNGQTAKPKKIEEALDTFSRPVPAADPEVDDMNDEIRVLRISH